MQDLQVTRKFLRDNGLTYPSDERGRRQVERLQRLYLERLCEAMAMPPHSAALLTEARKFLTWAGVHPSTPAASAGPLASELLAMEVPFATKH